MIPKILHRVVPAEVPDRFEGFWDAWCEMHPGWVQFTWQDPLNPSDWELGPLFHRCSAGAQLAGLVRLEVVFRLGGVYIDMDMEPVRPLDELLVHDLFIGTEGGGVLTDAMFGATPRHPGLGACVELLGSGWWDANPSVTGPLLTTQMLSGRDDVTVLPKEAFYPYLWTEPERAGEEFPDSFAVHRWNHSWKGWNQ